MNRDCISLQVSRLRLLVKALMRKRVVLGRHPHYLMARNANSRMIEACWQPQVRTSILNLLAQAFRVPYIWIWKVLFPSDGDRWRRRSESPGLASTIDDILSTPALLKEVRNGGVARDAIRRHPCSLAHPWDMDRRRSPLIRRMVERLLPSHGIPPRLLTSPPPCRMRQTRLEQDDSLILHPCCQ